MSAPFFFRLSCYFHNACSIELPAVEMSLVNVMSREIILKMLLENFKADYGYIIVDYMH